MKNDKGSKPEHNAELPGFPRINGATDSPWFPFTGTDEDRASRLAEVLRTIRFEARPDPDPHALWDGYMVVAGGEPIQWPFRVLGDPDGGGHPGRPA